MSKFDEEKIVGEIHSYGSESSPHEDIGEVIISNRPKFLQNLNHFLSRLGGEERGIERVLPHERSNQVSQLPRRFILTSSTHMIIFRYG